MQKDIHFYLTYALSSMIGIPPEIAEKIAWADYYTDDLKDAELYGIQTQSAVLGNWSEKQIQISVLIPFHFIPGNNAKHPWMTTRNNSRARELVELAINNEDLFQLGISLHGLQDTFSHQRFSGWEEDLNNCYSWYYIQSAIPNIGHAEMFVTPDVVNFIWIDPRSGRRIDNRKRAMRAAKETYKFLGTFFGFNYEDDKWQPIEKKLWRIFTLKSYDKRIDSICRLSDNEQIDYDKVKKKLLPIYKSNFIKAARRHLAGAMELFHDIPFP